MMASLILVVAFIGMIEAVTLTSGTMDHARRQALADQIIKHEIEKLRYQSWTQIQALANSAALPINSTNNPDSPFLTAIAKSGATFSLSSTVTDQVTGNLREVAFTVTWTVTTSRLQSNGSLTTFTYSRTNVAWFGKNGLNLSYQRS